jgi:hypothetical protein
MLIIGKGLDVRCRGATIEAYEKQYAAREERAKATQQMMSCR